MSFTEVDLTDYLDPELTEFIEAALWALQSDQTDKAKEFLFKALDKEGYEVSIRLTQTTTEVEVN